MKKEQVVKGGGEQQIKKNGGQENVEEKKKNRKCTRKIKNPKDEKSKKECIMKLKLLMGKNLNVQNLGSRGPQGNLKLKILKNLLY